ncbi:MAG: hypothetical protein WC683_07425 [bacterium]
MMQKNAAQCTYCEKVCAHLIGSSSCRTVCPLDSPHITREDRQSGSPQRLLLSVFDQVHLLDLADIAKLLQQGLLVHCYQEGPSEMRKGQIIPSRERTLTGSLHMDRDGDLVRISLFTRPELLLVTLPAWLEQVANEIIPVAPCRELPPEGA